MEDDLMGPEEKAVKKYKSSDQFAHDLANELLVFFFEGFKYCKKMTKELLLDFNTALLVPSIGTPEEIVTIVAKDII